ncbi:protein eva-1 homolog C isoform X2 [Salminus brasiliensis]|uniref:protein eva-1 homolog C isoform X2 n=1 Tax=Salminus brasiliensis TaxID=930266 RepID=UPI003B836F98
MTSSQHTDCCPPRPWRALQILSGLLLLWSRETHGLSDFSNYLFRIINSHSARARDGERALLSCPRHSTIAVHAAFYGQNGARIGHELTASCSARTALQKMLSECQGHRNCQVLVHHHLFGRDPCPGTPKHLHVTYSCKPTEHKNRTGCEGGQMLLHCKYPKVLNIYWAMYGRELEERDACLAEGEQPPPFDAVRSLCYGKQRCLLAVDDEHFRNPCPPETKKYLTVLYSCVPQILLKEADPAFFKTTSAPHQTTKAGDLPHPRLPEKNGILVSNSLMAYGYIKEHAEMAGLLFVSSVCLGLLVVLLAISTRVTCTRNLDRTSCLITKAPEKLKSEEDDEDDDDSDDDEVSEPLMDSSMMSEVGRKVYCWEEMTYTTEAAELMERLERREMVIEEIRMNAYLNGTSCTLH